MKRLLCVNCTKTIGSEDGYYRHTATPAWPGGSVFCSPENDGSKVATPPKPLTDREKCEGLATENYWASLGL